MPAMCVVGLTASSMKSSSDRSPVPGLIGEGRMQMVPRMHTPFLWLGRLVIFCRVIDGWPLLAALICANQGDQTPFSAPIAEVSFCSHATSMTPGETAAPVLKTIDPWPTGRPSMRLGVLQCAPLSPEYT